MAPSLRCITFLTVLFFSIYLIVILLRACRKVASCTHDVLLPMLMRAADALTLVPMLCILMINSRQRATQLNPAVGDPQPWAQKCMYACVAALVLRLVLIVVEHLASDDGGVPRASTREGSPGSTSGDDKERECDQQHCSQSTALDKALLVGHAFASLAVYGCCAAIVVSMVVMKRPYSMETPPLTPMMVCSTVLTVLYLIQYLVLEIMGYLSSRTGRWSGIQQDTTAMLGPYGEPSADVSLQRGRPEDEAYIKIEPVTLQFIPMYCVLLVGIGLRAVQLNLQPDKWACAAMFVTTAAIVIQAAAVPLFKHMLPVPDNVQEEEDDPNCIPSARKMEENQSRLPPYILTVSWSLLMVCLYAGIAATLLTVFAMEAEPLDAVWPEKQIGLLQDFLKHLEKSRHLMQSEALHALNTASIPPISTAMRCTMLLTVLYFGVFLGVLVGRAVCGPARKQAAFVNEAVEEYLALEQDLSEAMQSLREHESRDPEQNDVVEEQENRRVEQLKEELQSAKDELQDRRALLRQAQASEAQVREGVQRSLAFVPMLCVIMIAVRMRAMQVHIRDPQPWAQITMYVASAAVTTQVLASILWACFVRADDFALSCGEVGLVGKVAAIFILAVRYIAALSLYAAMIALVVALTSMQQGLSISA